MIGLEYMINLSYLIPAVLTAGCVAVIMFVIHRCIRKQNKLSISRYILHFAFILYISIFVAMIVGTIGTYIDFSMSSSPEALEFDKKYNLVPILTLFDIPVGHDYRVMRLGILNGVILPNILLFIPLGIFIPLLMKRMRRLGYVALVSLSVSLVVEVTMYLFQSTTYYADINNVIFNVLGACVGYAFFSIYHHIQLKRKNTRINSNQPISTKAT